jgi:uncharacterized protein YbcC (UPF0753/DUF2309 family)
MKAHAEAGYSGAHLELIAASEKASRAIPPLWPLSSSVAVNPFLGQTEQTLPEVAALLDRVAGTPVTMPRDWYAARIDDGRIAEADLAAALSRRGPASAGAIATLKKAAAEAEATPTALPTVAELAAQVSDIDWPGLIEDRIGVWAAGYFDRGQALWQATPGRGAFESWQIFASRDLTPEIAGLAGFAAHVAQTPPRARSALAMACDDLGIGAKAAPTYFHQLLLSLGGWAQLGRQHLWQAELAQGSDPVTTELLTLRLVWEQALYAQYRSEIEALWAKARAQHATPVQPTQEHEISATLQEAAECAAQRKLAQTLAAPGAGPTEGRAALQAAFCIDVRSEVFRRALESLDPSIETLGFAGFFGLTAAHRAFASDVVEMRLPVLLTPGLKTAAGGDETAGAEQSARLSARAARAWGRFKLAAVSSFAFVEATGPVYAGKLLRDALGLQHAQAPDPHAPHVTDALSLEDKLAAARKILGAMSLTSGFAPVVLIVGHGANVVNNPHASALHCGACGGYSGDVNARLLAGLLNAPDVREGLKGAGIDIPDDTRFIGALHDTTTDAVTLFDADPAQNAGQALEKITSWLATAGKIARTERAMRLPRAISHQDVAKRSADWSETRPEWALAGCEAFIAAPRARTRGKALEGRALLHDYDWQKDEGFGVLELILTAPVVVASWISLQYYGSVTAPEVFGAGNKVLHNVTGGIGVVEGNGGALRGGLPWQSVHDGTDFVHDPLRLSVCVEAPREAVSDILARHPQVQALFDNRWLHLFLLDGQGQIAERYTGDLGWEAFDNGAPPVKAAEAA